MKPRPLTKIFAFLLIGLFIGGPMLYADDIKTRMKNRLPVILELKAKGIVGENNKGYLEFVGGKSENADVVAAENEDRKTVYAAIAKQQGTTVELVGKRRALQISQKADAGDWLQDASGNWYQKK
jgi:uncharacterized protein YdbL (DUF1318 family)